MPRAAGRPGRESPLLNDLEGRRLTDQIKALRKTLAAEYGFVIPPVRILDNMRLPTQGYALRIKEMESGTGEVRLGHLMAMDPRGGQVELPDQNVVVRPNGEYTSAHQIGNTVMELA